MRVKRVDYVKRDGVIRRSAKTIIELVEPDACVIYRYEWSSTYNRWEPVNSTAYFDGSERREVGCLRMKENAERYLDLLTKYSGFEFMESDEDNKDTDKEDKYLKEILMR